MAVTDLTGTTWVFNDSIDVSTSFYYSINFISNDSSFAALEASYPDLSYYYWGAPTTIYSNGWYNANYKTISITGGTDATNSSLISWLEANATQQGGPSITDLTNTTWKFNTSITISTMPYTTNPRSFAVIVYYEPYAEYGNYSSITFSDTRDRGTYNNAVLSGEMPEQYIAGDIEITFLGGTSATDLTLISWLQANATQVVNETYLTTGFDLTSIADAIRTKGGTSASLVYPAGYISAINALPTGALQSYKSAVFTSPGSATLTPDSGYVGIEEISVEYSPAIYDGAYHTEGLVDTTWYFNDTIDLDSFETSMPSATANITFNSNNTTYIEMTKMPLRARFYYGSTIVYNSSWTNQNYRTVSISGGTDATNATLMAWFQANATQIS